MTIYVDYPKIRGKRASAHLMADTKEELHEFAVRYGIKRCWYDGNRRHPHYDLVGRNLELILSVLAPTSTREMLRRINEKKKMD